MVLNDWRQGLSEQSHGTPSETERTGAPETAANKKLEPLVIASHMPTSAQLLRARCEVPVESVEALEIRGGTRHILFISRRAKAVADPSTSASTRRPLGLGTVTCAKGECASDLRLPNARGDPDTGGWRGRCSMQICASASRSCETAAGASQCRPQLRGRLAADVEG